MTSTTTRTSPHSGLLGVALIAAAFVNMSASAVEPTTIAIQGELPTWKAGGAKAVITPQTSVWLAGYGTKRAPDGKLHELWAKAMALEDEKGRRVVLITSDFQGVP